MSHGLHPCNMFSYKSASIRANLVSPVSIYGIGRDYVLMLSHQACGVFISSQTITETIVHVFFPVLCMHYLGGCFISYAQSVVSVDTCLVKKNNIAATTSN